MVAALLCESAVINMNNMFMSCKGNKSYFKKIFIRLNIIMVKHTIL